MPVRAARILLLGALAVAPALWAADDETVALLAARSAETRQLLATMDSLIAELSQFADYQLHLADSAPDATARARYEALYGETQARIDELQAQRGQIGQLLTELDARMEQLRHAP